MSAAPRVSPSIGTPSALPASHVAHREQTRSFVRSSAEPWHREHLTRLDALWQEWNAAHFDGAMIPPYLMLLEPTSARAFGDTSAISGFGGRLQIRLRPSLLTGAHKAMRAGAAYAEGRFRFVADVLLHEMIHQWQREVANADEESYHGHGPAFRDRANVIGGTLGLAPVRTSKARGPERDLPSCAHWPHNVRPDDYYLGAYIREVPTDGDTEGERGPVEPESELTLTDRLASMPNHELSRVLADVLNRRPISRCDDPAGLWELYSEIVFKLDDERQDELLSVVMQWLGDPVDDDDDDPIDNLGGDVLR